MSHAVQFRPATYREQVALLIDVRDLSQEDTKLQSCKTARPGMKISGKEDDAVVWLITGWWQEDV
jgi:hypothetical protein